MSIATVSIRQAGSKAKGGSVKKITLYKRDAEADAGLIVGERVDLIRGDGPREGESIGYAIITANDETGLAFQTEGPGTVSISGIDAVELAACLYAFGNEQTDPTFHRLLDVLGVHVDDDDPSESVGSDPGTGEPAAHEPSEEWSAVTRRADELRAVSTH
jgi:hypothetical protein